MATEKPIVHQTPDWETGATPRKGLSKFNIFNTKSPAGSEEDPAAERATTARRTFSDRFIPHWFAPCFGRNRKTCICAFAALALLVLVLGLGLGLGLHKGLVDLNTFHPAYQSECSSKKAKNLPLPSNTATFTGDLTYYSPGPGYGACGYENTSQDSICAVSHTVWDAVSTSTNPNANPLCGKKIRITRYDASKGGNSSADVTVVDRCTGCQPDDLDLSLSVFERLAEETEGRVVGSWAWLN